MPGAPRKSGNRLPTGQAPKRPPRLSKSPPHRGGEGTSAMGTCGKDWESELKVKELHRFSDVEHKVYGQGHTEDGKPGKGTGRHIAAFVLRGAK